MQLVRGAGAAFAAALVCLSGCVPMDSERTTVSEPAVTSALVAADGWEQLEGSATGYWNAILAEELTAGDGAGSRVVIQEGIPSALTAREHRDNRVLELQGRGIDAVAIGERMIDAAPAAGLYFRQVGRVHETWYVVKGGLRYVIHLQSHEGATQMSEHARDVLAHIQIRP